MPLKGSVTSWQVRPEGVAGGQAFAKSKRPIALAVAHRVCAEGQLCKQQEQPLFSSLRESLSAAFDSASLLPDRIHSQDPFSSWALPTSGTEVVAGQRWMYSFFSYPV